MRERDHLKTVGKGMGGLSNKNKRVVGWKYQLQRFSVGDVLRRSDGIEGKVMVRQSTSCVVRWKLGPRVSLMEAIAFGKTEYLFVESV